MTKSHKWYVLPVLTGGVGLFFIFGKVDTSAKGYSDDRQYSFYTKMNAYEWILPTLTMPGDSPCRKGTVYLYDETEETLLFQAPIGCKDEMDLIAFSATTFYSKSSEFSIELPRKIKSGQK